ncbi:MAG TPA: hypothetical protein VF147_02440, partial [Vicinamibacterales bacterium]
RSDLKRARRDTGAERSQAHSAMSAASRRPAAVTAAAATTPEERVQRRSAVTEAVRRRPRTAAAALVALLGLIAIAVVMYGKRTPAYTERDEILVTDFVNTTGEGAFDDALRQALTVNLEQSPYLNVVSSERIRETLNFMGRPPDERITERIGREICARRGIKALLVGSIGSLGSRYVVTLKVLSAANGDTLTSTQKEAGSREAVLQSLGAAASDIRERLGESLASLQRFDAPIEQATTASLDALKAFTTGNERRAAGREQEALPFYQRAVELDPNFAMAYARLSVIHYNHVEFAKSFEYAKLAYDRRDRVSERERFYITARYQTMTGDTAALQQTYELWKETYPRDTAPRNNLSILYGERGDSERAIAEALEANRLDPSMPFAYANLCYGYRALNRLAEAKAIAARGLELRPAYGELHACKFVVAYIEGDSDTMARVVTDTSNMPAAVPVTDMRLRALLAKGKLSEMRRELQPLEQALRQRGSEAAFSELLAGYALDASLVGASTDALEWADRAMTLANEEDVAWPVVSVYYMNGRAPKAAALQAKLDVRFARDSSWTTRWGPTNTALAAIARRDYAAAVEAMRTPETLDRAMPGLPLIRGMALLGAGRPSDAATAFQRVIDNHYVAEPSVLNPVAHVWLARARAKAGDADGARRAYQDGLALFKDGDTDLPLVVEARQEYERLGK